jgi:hypothetical protein
LIWLFVNLIKKTIKNYKNQSYKDKQENGKESNIKKPRELRGFV